MEEVKSLINVNIGVLGHVDSGKTSLCKSLSTKASTAAFDSNPQSKERGITLDLGFSAFPLENKWSVTLVDCPGHATLIRTVLGGVQIMDIMLLIIDITKGMQPQTAECLILANICCPHLIVVLNKVDLVEEGARTAKIDKVTKLLSSTLSKTRFAGQPIVVASAVDSDVGTTELKNVILRKLDEIEFKRDTDSPFLMAVDHCFNIKGSGAVCTGTILQGKIKIGDALEFPELQATKKVKSIQMFKVPVQDAHAGDRVAIGVPGLEAKQLERGIVCEPGFIKSGVRVAVIKISKVPFYKEPIESKRRYHISIGYCTVTAMVTLFQPVCGSGVTDFDLDTEYEYVPEVKAEKKTLVEASSGENVYAVLEFDKPVFMLPNTLVIGSNLQLTEETLCRLAFHGKVIHSSHDKDFKSQYLPRIHIFWWKTKEGSIDRVVSPDAIIAKGFCTKQSNIDHLIGLKVTIITDPEKAVCPVGRIESRFGQTDKIRIGVSPPLSDEQVQYFKSTKSKIELKYKRLYFKDGSAKSRKLVQ